jgi:hypothetical protein
MLSWDTKLLDSTQRVPHSSSVSITHSRTASHNRVRFLHPRKDHLAKHGGKLVLALEASQCTTTDWLRRSAPPAVLCATTTRTSRSRCRREPPVPLRVILGLAVVQAAGAAMGMRPRRFVRLLCAQVHHVSSQGRLVVCLKQSICWSSTTLLAMLFRRACTCRHAPLEKRDEAGCTRVP